MSEDKHKKLRNLERIAEIEHTRVVINEVATEREILGKQKESQRWATEVVDNMLEDAKNELV